jgi:hypothetical protein
MRFILFTLTVKVFTITRYGFYRHTLVQIEGEDIGIKAEIADSIGLEGVNSEGKIWINGAV